MPRYYFDLHNDVDSLDDQGCVFPDDAAAIEHGIMEARHMAAHSVDQGHLIKHDRIEVRDEDRQLVRVVRFGEAVLIAD